MKVQEANFAGKFYPNSDRELTQLFRNYQHDMNVDDLPENEIIGGVVPHAGYVYSGKIASRFYQLLAKQKSEIETFIVVNPNHSGYGNGAFNLSGVEAWETPFGDFEIDQKFEKELDISDNNWAHKNEHSGEVQLPFLKYFAPAAKLVMITMNTQSCKSAAMLAEKLHAVRKKLSRKIIVIASSDFSHFERAEVGFRKDQLVLDAMLQFDVAKIEEEVQANKISVCGYGPIMTLLHYAKFVKSAPEIKILARDNSGSVHYSREVVDYISAIVF